MELNAPTPVTATQTSSLRILPRHLLLQGSIWSSLIGLPVFEQDQQV